jgi:hypothetical protein
VELPADFLAEASAQGLRRSALEAFAALQVPPCCLHAPRQEHCLSWALADRHYDHLG